MSRRIKRSRKRSSRMKRSSRRMKRSSRIKKKSSISRRRTQRKTRMARGGGESMEQVFDIVDDYDYQDIEGGVEIGNGVKVVLGADEEVYLGMVRKKYTRDEARELLIFPNFKFGKRVYNELLKKLSAYGLDTPPGARNLEMKFYLRRKGKDTELDKLNWRVLEGLRDGPHYTFSMHDKFVIKGTWDGDEHSNEA